MCVDIHMIVSKPDSLLDSDFDHQYRASGCTSQPVYLVLVSFSFNGFVTKHEQVKRGARLCLSRHVWYCIHS